VDVAEEAIELPRLDEKLFIDAFNQQPRPAKAAAKRR